MKRLRSRGLGRAALAVLLPTLLLVSAAYPPAFAQDATPAAQSMDLTGVAPRSLTGERRAKFEAYVADALLRFGVPGASIAVVQGGDVVYLNGFGVRTFGSTQPVTPDTLMMIGSVTKSMTTMLAATLVDDGHLTWDTRLVDLLPDFAVGDPELTESLTVRDAFCNCAGIPGRDIELFFESNTFTPQGVVTTLANVAPTATLGERFQYNNLLIGAAGYAVGVAAGGGAVDVALAYDVAMRERVLGPIGMTRSTFDPKEVLSGGDYAVPHATDLSGTLQPVPLVSERSLLPVAPAGALWSNAREMARYVQTELAQGVAPDGTRFVSAENLETTWAPGVTLPTSPALPAVLTASQMNYGLGWNRGTYHGERLISHSGGTYGFASEVAFLPEANFGIVILTNARTPFAAFNYAVQFRLLELLFDQPSEIDGQMSALADAAQATGGIEFVSLDPSAVAPFLGRYASPELGVVSISMRGDRLVMDVGELSSELRPRQTDGQEAAVYLFHDPPLSLISEGNFGTVRFEGGDSQRRILLTIPANPTGPERIFVFEAIARDGTPTP
jgi:CubicO group peptidase (beta-lactamase class C family)